MMLDEYGKFNLESYGYKLEEYVYDIDPYTEELETIDYTRFKPNGEQEVSVTVDHKDKTKPIMRTVVFWDKEKDGNGPGGYMNSPVLEMKLDLSTIDPDFDLSSIVIYNYENCTHDSDEFCIELYKKDTDPGCENSDAMFFLDKGSKAAYYKDQNMYKIYSEGDEHCSEEIWVLDNCVVAIDHNDAIIDVFYYNGFREQFRAQMITNSPIDCIRDFIYCEIVYGDGHLIKYNYNDDGTFKDLEATYDESKLTLYRVETTLEEFKDNPGKQILDSYRAVYPIMITPNVKNMNYEFFDLWCIDCAEYNKNGSIFCYTKEIYYIPEDNVNQLVEDLNLEPESLILM